MIRGRQIFGGVSIAKHGADEAIVDVDVDEGLCANVDVDVDENVDANGIASVDVDGDAGVVSVDMKMKDRNMEHKYEPCSHMEGGCAILDKMSAASAVAGVIETGVRVIGILRYPAAISIDTAVTRV